MNEDRLLRDLGHLAKEEERAERARLDERWDRLAAGTLTAEEEAELRALADTSPEAREAWEAFQPLGPEFQARVVDKIAAELPQEKRGRVLPFPVRIGGWVTAAAAAAAVLFVVVPPSAPLPGYQMGDVTGISGEMRGELSEEPLTFAPGDRIQVNLHPETEFRARRLKGQLFLLQDGELRLLDTESEIDPAGAAKLTASLGRDLRPGDWTLWAVIGRSGKLPEPAELPSLAAQGRPPQSDWAAVSKGIRIRGP